MTFERSTAGPDYCNVLLAGEPPGLSVSTGSAFKTRGGEDNGPCNAIAPGGAAGLLAFLSQKCATTM
jgi:hypothetical protein